MNKLYGVIWLQVVREITNNKAGHYRNTLKLQWLSNERILNFTISFSQCNIISDSSKNIVYHGLVHDQNITSTKEKKLYAQTYINC